MMLVTITTQERDHTGWSTAPAGHSTHPDQSHVEGAQPLLTESVPTPRFPFKRSSESHQLLNSPLSLSVPLSVSPIDSGTTEHCQRAQERFPLYLLVTYPHVCMALGREVGLGQRTLSPSLILALVNVLGLVSLGICGQVFHCHLWLPVLKMCPHQSK